MDDHRQILRTAAVGWELETAIRLTQIGLRELQGIGGRNDFYHLPFLTLANGFERYLKVILCLRFHETKGRFPTYKELVPGRRGHDLTALLERIIADCFSDQYVSTIPAAAEDIEFLRASTRLRQIVDLLSRFGQAARYYNLDLILGRDPDTDSPEDEWARLELALLAERPDLQAQLTQPGGLDGMYLFTGAHPTAVEDRVVAELQPARWAAREGRWG